MQNKSGNSSSDKPGLHLRNKHQGSYDFDQLKRALPELEKFIHLNKYKNQSIDFFNPLAVKTLNKALLYHHYSIKEWDIPDGYLCPPVPGRADYIHHLADLLFAKNSDYINSEEYNGKNIRCLDIGVGANCIYPIIGVKEYGWSFVASDIDPIALESAAAILSANPDLNENVELRLQKDLNLIFDGIINQNERFAITICNPPFHSSFEEASAGTKRKLSNLKNKKVKKVELNFGGRSNELIYKGGEEQFVNNMIIQSKTYPVSCIWFSTLISKESKLKEAYKSLKKVKAKEIKTIAMSQGNKKSRILAWTFMTKPEQKECMNQMEIPYL